MSGVDLFRRAAELADAGEAFVVVTLARVSGSAPADAGAKMLVTVAGLDTGTVGGGRVEAKAIDLALAMLRDGVTAPSLVDWSLKADVGMTCGGRVSLVLEPVGVGGWEVVVFGAGHVSQALAPLLVGLPCRVTVVDPRPEWLGRLPAGVRRVHAPEPAHEVDALPDGAYVLCMTRGHASDLPVLERLYKSGRDFPYVGVIGSRAKAAVLRKELTAAGIDPKRLAFHCPVGLPIGTNHPGEIAVSIAAQLLSVRDGLTTESTDSTELTER